VDRRRQGRLHPVQPLSDRHIALGVGEDVQPVLLDACQHPPSQFGRVHRIGGHSLERGPDARQQLGIRPRNRGEAGRARTLGFADPGHHRAGTDHGYAQWQPERGELDGGAA